jgi:PAS domain S-box-containing protein
MKAADHFQVVHASVGEDDWRSPLLNTALRLSCLLGVLWLVSFLIATPGMRRTPEAVVFAVSAMVACSAAMRPRSPEWFRLTALLQLFLIPIGVAYTFLPPTAGTGVLLALAVLLATLYHGRGAGIAAVILVLALYVGCGMAWENHIFPLRPSSILVHSNGLAYWLRIGTAQIIGTIALVAVALYVVRHSQRTLKELHRSEQLLRTVVEATHDGIWDWDIVTGKVQWSDRVYVILGAVPGSFGVTFDRARELVHPDDRPRFVALIDAQLHSQVPFDIELRLQRGDGSYGYYRSRGQTMRGADGKPLRMVGSISDETERRQMDDALKAGAALLRQFVKHTPAAVAMFDTQMHYIQVSDRWLTDYRLGGVELTGLSHYEVFPGMSERWKEIHRRALAGAVERNDDDFFSRPNGDIEWLQWEIQPWRQPDGAIGGVIMFTQLMNERKRSEQKIQDQLTELQRWQRVTLGREKRFQELKQEVNALCQQLGRAPRYPGQSAGKTSSNVAAAMATETATFPKT